MTRDPERDLRFVVGMIAVPCVICGLAALLGVPAAGGLFFGMAGTLLGIGAARALLPRRDRGLTVRPILALAAGGLFAGYRLSVVDFSTGRGLLLWGLNFGFCSLAVSRLTDPVPPHRTRGWRRDAARGPRRAPILAPRARPGGPGSPHRRYPRNCG